MHPTRLWYTTTPAATTKREMLNRRGSTAATCHVEHSTPDDTTVAVHSHMTNTKMTDPEVLEQRFPVRVDSFSIRHGSGGQGKFPGGDGIVRKVTFLEDMKVTLLTSHRHTDPYGLDGGEPGARGRNAVRRTDGRVDELLGNDETDMAPGDCFIMETPGGGAYGAAEG